MLEQFAHRCQQLKQNIPVPKNSCHHNSFFAQGSYEQCELHFCLSDSQLPELLHISVGSIPVCEYDPIADDPLKPCSLFVEQAHGKLHQDVFEVDHRELSACFLVSRLHGTCIPTLSDLSCLCRSLKPSSRDFKRSTSLEASSFCRTVKLLLSPGKAEGLPKRN